jgi:hypothetical protein
VGASRFTSTKRTKRDGTVIGDSDKER